MVAWYQWYGILLEIICTSLNISLLNLLKPLPNRLFLVSMFPSCCLVLEAGEAGGAGAGPLLSSLASPIKLSLRAPEKALARGVKCHPWTVGSFHLAPGRDSEKRLSTGIKSHPGAARRCHLKKRKKTSKQFGM